MILDREALFADKLDVAGTPNVIDTGILHPADGEPLIIFVQVDAGVTGCTGCSLRHSDDGTNDLPLMTITDDEMAGKIIHFTVPSSKTKRYLHLFLAGTVSGGTWTAGVVLPGVQSAK